MPQISVIVPVYNVEKYLDTVRKEHPVRRVSATLSFCSSTMPQRTALSPPRANSASTRACRCWTNPTAGSATPGITVPTMPRGNIFCLWTPTTGLKKTCSATCIMLAEAYRADLVVFNYVRENTENAEQPRMPSAAQLPGMRHRDPRKNAGGADRPGRRRRAVAQCGNARLRLAPDVSAQLVPEQGIRFGNEQKIMLEDLPASIRAHCVCKRLLVVGGTYYHYRYNPDSLSTRYRPGKMEMLTACFETVKKILEECGVYEQYRERHLAWFLRSAAHSSLVNCFSPANPADFGGRWREVRGILQNPILRQAVKSDYLKHGARADRIVLRVLRTRFTPFVYLFYKTYSAIAAEKRKEKIIRTGRFFLPPAGSTGVRNAKEKNPVHQLQPAQRRHREKPCHNPVAVRL